MEGKQNNFDSVRIGIIMALLTLLMGIFLGIGFGGFEGKIKGYLKSRARSVLDTSYHNDTRRMKKVAGKAWAYFKMAHFHANGLGTISLVLIVYLSFTSTGEKYKLLTSTSLGLGAFGYPLFWILTALKATKMGSTSGAKESLAWLAAPSAGLCFIGLTLVLFVTIKPYFTRSSGKP